MVADVIARDYRDVLSHSELEDVFWGRAKQYGEIWERTTAVGEPPRIQCLQELTRFVRGGSHNGQVVMRPPYDLSGGILRHLFGTQELLGVEAEHVGALEAVVVRMCIRSPDIRTLSEWEAVAAVKGLGGEPE